MAKNIQQLKDRRIKKLEKLLSKILHHMDICDPPSDLHTEIRKALGWKLVKRGPLMLWE